MNFSKTINLEMFPQSSPYISFTFLLLLSLANTSKILSQESLAVTIYNNDFAMIKDVRQIRFDQGQSTLYFTDVSANIQTATVTFKSLESPGSISVYEQNFERNLIDRHSILKKYIDKQIQIVGEFGDQLKRLSGTLLAQDNDFIIKTGTQVFSLTKVPMIELPSIPQGFFTLPTLNWKVSSRLAQTSKCQVAYRTTGFKWSADYTIILNNDVNKGDLAGWVTIDNNSGKKYVNAKLKLVAGEVNVVQPPVPKRMGFIAKGMLKTFSMSAEAAPVFAEKSFADYHLYTLSAPVTLNQQSQKQIEFIPKIYGVQIRKYNQISITSGGRNQNNLQVLNKLQFNNSKLQGLGIPLPKGTIRIFKQDDSDNSLEFIGEDAIAHTPKNENITLSIGRAFDIVGNLVVSDKVNLTKNGGYKANLIFTITNHRDTEADIEVMYNTYNGENLKITWDPQNPTSLIKQNAALSKIIFRIKANQVVSYNWKEQYKP